MLFLLFFFFFFLGGGGRVIEVSGLDNRLDRANGVNGASVVDKMKDRNVKESLDEVKTGDREQTNELDHSGVFDELEVHVRIQ